MNALIRLLLERLAAGATPLSKADAHLLVELLAEGWKSLERRGIACRYGGEGKGLCVPGRWSEADLAERDRTCRHCPVFRKVRSERRG